MQHKTYFAAAFLLFLAACTKFEDADTTERNTFVHFYSSGTDYLGLVAELDDDGGYILSGEIRHDNGLTDGLIVKTDPRGHKIWEKVIPNGIINGIKASQNGYVLVGDSIQLNPGSPDVNELVNTYARLMLMDKQGNTVAQHITSGSVKRTVNNQFVDLNVDYHAQALTLDQSGNIVVLGSFRIPGGNESSFVSAFDAADISDSLWYRSYSSLDHDYVNCNSLYITSSSEIVWASKMFSQEQNLSREYLCVPNVALNSAHLNNSLFGERDARNHAVEDMQRSPVGYCAIGTNAETNGLNANIFFVRIDANLNVIPESAKYIDGEFLMINNALLAAPTESRSFDEGLAVVAIGDGFILAGAMTSTPTVGNGGKDILLVKLDPFGNLIWKKLLGGTGDETASSIRETPDGGLLICGTNTINGLSTMMLMKTDRNGNLDN